MPLPEPVPGLVISYAYLWRNQQEQGRDEGVKDRPCVVVLAVRQEEGERIVTVAPVTHAPPANSRDAIELPAPVKLRLGLDAFAVGTVIADRPPHRSERAGFPHSAPTSGV